MRHSVLVRTLVLLLLLGLLIALPTLVGCKKDPVTPGVPIADEGSEEEQDEGEDAGEDATDGADDGDEAAAAPRTPTELTVRLYWVSAGENALGVDRTVPYSASTATAAMNALLAGPTPEERTTWPAIDTAIPAGTSLLSVMVEGGVAKVDLSGEFESGGGTFSMTARLAQVVYTLTELPTVDAVEFFIDGRRVEMFSGEGLILDGPQTLDDFARLLPIDA